MGHNLKIPQLLEKLIASGRWPRDCEEANRQHSHPLATPERVMRLAYEENTIFLYPPPFQTVREHSAGNSFWKGPQSDPEGIDFDLALVISDFGLGSDAPILLDYRGDRHNPHLLRLRYTSDGNPSRWVGMCADFRIFAVALGLLDEETSGQSWLHPFSPIESDEEASRLVTELRLELKPGHPLFRIPVKAVGRRHDCDNVLYQLLDGSERMAEVQLTWAGANERPPWPDTTIFTDFGEWLARKETQCGKSIE